MRTNEQIQRELDEARNQRGIALAKCNVLAAEFQWQHILRLHRELHSHNCPAKVSTNRLIPYFAGQFI